MPHRMMRREFALAAGAGAFGSSGVGCPVQAGEGETLYFIVRNDLCVLEAIWATAYVTRNHGYMGYDTLFVLDSRDHRSGRLHVEGREGRGARGFPDDFE
jgi:peptide/nickel transport system substrate-binding protein